MDRPTVLHVIGSLDIGGAERALCKVLAQLRSGRANYHVASLIPGGPLIGEIERLSIPVYSMEMRRGIPSLKGLLRLMRLMRHLQPDVVVTWMYHSNIIGGIAAALAGRFPVIWNMRDFGPNSYRKFTTRVTALLSRRSARLLCSKLAFVSQASCRAYLASGFPPDRVVTIPNGFDTGCFAPNSEFRGDVRSGLGIAADTQLIGMIARVHPVKDFKTFLEAAARIHRSRPSAQFLLCGDGASPSNQELVHWITSAGIRKVTHLLGRRFDIPRIIASLDVAVSSSVSEAFPNAIGEAMSCGVPCVVTDVGDSAYLVGDTGRIVPPSDCVSLSSAISELLDLSPINLRKLGVAARHRIINHFSIEKVAPQYEKLWLSLVDPCRYCLDVPSTETKAA